MELQSTLGAESAVQSVDLIWIGRSGSADPGGECQKFKMQLFGELSQSSRDSFESDSDSNEARDD